MLDKSATNIKIGLRKIGLAKKSGFVSGGQWCLRDLLWGFLVFEVYRVELQNAWWWGSGVVIPVIVCVQAANMFAFAFATLSPPVVLPLVPPITSFVAPRSLVAVAARVSPITSHSVPPRLLSYVDNWKKKSEKNK